MANDRKMRAEFQSAPILCVISAPVFDKNWLFSVKFIANCHQSKSLGILQLIYQCVYIAQMLKAEPYVSLAKSVFIFSSRQLNSPEA